MHKSEYVLDERYFQNEASFMGPIAIGQDGAFNFLAAYEHGSQFPDRFLQFQLSKNKKVTIQSVKGNIWINNLLMASKAYGSNLLLYLAARINWPANTGTLFFAISPKTVKAGSPIYFIIHGAGRKECNGVVKSIFHQ